MSLVKQRGELFVVLPCNFTAGVNHFFRTELSPLAFGPGQMPGLMSRRDWIQPTCAAFP